MTFQGYVCWDPADIDRVAPIDVASIEHTPGSDSAVFVATHQPLRLLKVAHAGATEGESIVEHTLLEDFTRPVGNDPQITVITGEVGTGKSHMVKWLHARCEGRASWHQVYIEKRNTNLRRVIETILVGLEGERVTELRQQLATATSQIKDLGQAKERVLHDLTYYVQFSSTGLDPASDYEAEARRQLPAVLNDPVLRQHLLREGGAIHRITRLGLEGLRRDDEDEHDLFLHPADLPLQPSDLADAAVPGQRAVTRLARNERLRTEAIRVLNLELAAAKAQVFVGSGVDLTGVFDEVRRELNGRGLELVLYIEDLVLLHGIDKELAQAFTEGRGPKGDRCGMRVAIAVTTGYLESGLETLTSRARHYSLNLKLGADVSTDQARAFVGGYLNAVRVGGSDLVAAHASASGDDEWVPNACDTCDHREACHGSFGTDAEGRGFYPLNHMAVDRLVALADGESPGDPRFDPRKVVRNVVRDPLRLAADELPEGRFPSKAFAGVLDPNRRSVAIEVQADLDRRADGERLSSLLGFWAPEPVTAVVALDGGVHEAFRLPRPGGASGLPADGGVTAEPSPPVPSRPAFFAEVDAWAYGTATLPAEPARIIRQTVFDVLAERLRYGPFGLRVLGANRKLTVGHVALVPEAVRIPAARGGGSELAREFVISFDQDAHTAVLFKAILGFAKTGTWPPEATEEYFAFLARVDAAAAEMALLAGRESVDLLPAVGVLALAGRPAVADAGTPGARLEAMLDEPGDGEGASGPRAAWIEAKAKARTQALLVLNQRLTAAKGTGASSIIDAAPILAPLTRAAGVRKVHEPLTGSEAFVGVQKTLDRRQRAVTSEIWGQVMSALEGLVGHIDDATGWDAMRSDITAAIEVAHQSGVLPDPAALAGLAALADAVPEGALTTARRLQRRASAEDRSLWDVTPDPVPGLLALGRFFDRADELLAAVEAHLDEDEDKGPVGPGRGSVAVGLRRLAVAVNEIVEGGAA